MGWQGSLALDHCESRTRAVRAASPNMLDTAGKAVLQYYYLGWVLLPSIQLVVWFLHTWSFIVEFSRIQLVDSVQALPGQRCLTSDRLVSLALNLRTRAPLANEKETMRSFRRIRQERLPKDQTACGATMLHAYVVNQLWAE